jgi:hypothetical protein
MFQIGDILVIVVLISKESNIRNPLKLKLN